MTKNEASDGPRRPVKRAGAFMLALVICGGLLLSRALGAPSPTPAELDAFSRASNAFALDLYAKARQREGNIVFSPASIELALGMAWAGARGETADEMQRVLRIDSPPDALHRAAGRILSAWDDPAWASYELRIANRLFGAERATFEPSFLELTDTHYGAPIEAVDFAGDPESQRKHINEWVAEQSSGHLPALLPAGSVTAETQLVLVNGVYFRGTWKNEFEASQTYDAPFYNDGATSTVRMMSQRDAYEYASVDGAQVLQMPYEDGDFAMLLVLPHERDGLPTLEESLSTAQVEQWVDALRAHEKVAVHVPRFEIRNARLRLGELLPEMGMRLAFQREHADFSGIADAENLHLTDIVHEAFIEVTEEGTEAAAFTSVVGAPMSARTTIPEFRADHPFLFFIRHVESGAILFMGRVAQPSV